MVVISDKPERRQNSTVDVALVKAVLSLQFLIKSKENEEC